MNALPYLLPMAAAAAGGWLCAWRSLYPQLHYTRQDRDRLAVMLDAELEWNGVLTALIEPVEVGDTTSANDRMAQVIDASCSPFGPVRRFGVIDGGVR